MQLNRKVHLVQAFFGAIILTLLMQPMGMLGYGNYMWMLFLPLLLFFALGAQNKNIPSMILCYVCGVVWAYLNGIVTGLLSKAMPSTAANIFAAIIIIFLLLTVHENFLANTIFGNVPALFMGMAETFFIFMIQPSNAPIITPVHLIAFFIYGIILAVALCSGGFLMCSLIFGKEKTISVLAPKEQKKGTVA